MWVNINFIKLDFIILFLSDTPIMAALMKLVDINIEYTFIMVTIMAINKWLKYYHFVLHLEHFNNVDLPYPLSHSKH